LEAATKNGAPHTQQQQQQPARMMDLLFFINKSQRIILQLI
jgi:hypothetical protein